VPLAVITFTFDPLLHIGDWTVRWETLGIAASILIALVVAALIAGRVPVPAHGTDALFGHLRRDDILFIAVGIVPGAVIGGRMAYVALHLDYFSRYQGTIADPATGGLALSGAVVLGALTGGLVARLFDAPIGRWYWVAVVPMLLALSLGKAANVLGGTGQGTPSTLDQATRYLGPGPWGSLGPDVPSIPAQAYEAIGVGVLLGFMVAAWILGAFRSRDARAFAVALGGWAVVRFGVAATWRDPAVLGPLRAEQLLDLGIIAIAIVTYVAIALRRRRRGEDDVLDEPADRALPAVAAISAQPTAPAQSTGPAQPTAPADPTGPADAAVPAAPYIWDEPNSAPRPPAPAAFPSSPGAPPTPPAELEWPDPETRRRF
jgi:prolipoprotein diacylglyceryltransferase